MSDDATTHDASQAGDAPSDPSFDEVDEILGQVIDGRYEIVSRIGAGGMGFVFDARHVQLGHRLVVKTLRPELVSSARVSERFTREAQATTRIRHPHVIDVKDFGVHPRFGAYYVMERLEGRDLQQLVDAEGALAPERALHILAQVASALAAAHSEGIVHRDLKPANVFLIEQGGDPDFVKVLDFGLARVMDANRRLTETGQVIGTPRYMAPEQCAGEKVDARADVFSAALILWEMLTGVTPFATLGTYEILGQKMLEPMRSPAALDPPVALPDPLERFLMSCLNKDPAARPADGAALLEQLQRVRKGGSAPAAAAPVVSAPPTSTPPSAPAATTPPRSRGALAALVAAAVFVVGLGAATGIGLLRWSREPAAPPAAPAPTPTPSVPAAPAVETHVVTVRSDPPGASVTVGPRALGTTPLDVRVPDDIPAGTVVRIALEGHTAREITIVEGVPTAHVRLHPTR